MCGKVILTLALIATVSIQLAHSLKCSTCYDVKTCKYPAKLHCDSRLANATRDALGPYYNDVRHLNSTDFSCFASRHGANNITLADLRGCITTGTVNCPNYYFSGIINTQHTCNICKKDLCNSVARISSSVVGTIVLLVSAKVFRM